MRHRSVSDEAAQAYWVAKPGDRVMTRDGLPGKVDEVQDGPQGGNETYIVTLDGGMGGGEYGAREISKIANVAPVGNVASNDYPVLAEILVERPPPPDVQRLTTGTLHFACAGCGFNGASPSANACPRCGTHVATAGLQTTASNLPEGDFEFHEDPDSGDYWWVHNCPNFAGNEYHTPDAVIADGVMTCPSCGASEPTTAEPQERTSSLQTEALDWGSKILNWIGNDVGTLDTSGNFTNWCRFRRDNGQGARCWYAKNYDAERSKEAGYTVWIPEDRGACPRTTWDEQKACPIGEPGPHVPGGYTDATIPWDQGGQRGYAHDPYRPLPVAKAAKGKNQDFVFHFTATWNDVRAKATRIAREGHVRILASPGTHSNGLVITAEVQGDTDVYQTSISRVPGKYAVAMWECGCAWSAYSWGRTGRWKRYEGRMCSHALALTYEAQKREMFGKPLTNDSKTPAWRDTSTLPKTYYDKDKGRSLATLASWHEDPAPAVTYAQSLMEDGVTAQAAMNALRTMGVAEVDAGHLIVEAMGAPQFPAQIDGIPVVVDITTGTPTVNGVPLPDPSLIIYPTYHPQRGLRMTDAAAHPCPACSGSGEQGTGHECYSCDGTGSAEEFDPGEDNSNPENGLPVGRRDDLDIEPVTAALHPDYMKGWRSSEKDMSGDALERADVRGVSRHWYDGFMDHATGRDKGWTQRDESGRMTRGPEEWEDEEHHTAALDCPAPEHHGEPGVNPLRLDPDGSYTHVDGSISHDDGTSVSDWIRPEGAAKKDDSPTVSGVALKAADTGRILMLQRGLGDEKDPAKGTWEFPGGHHEDGDQTSLHAGIREWEEEVGQKFPEGGYVAHTWRNGPYQGHVVVIPEEKVVCLHQGRDLDNPDDPDGDESEQVAWWDPEDAKKNPALREECKTSPWKNLKEAIRVVAGSPRDTPASAYGMVYDPQGESNLYVQQARTYAGWDSLPTTNLDIKAKPLTALEEMLSSKPINKVVSGAEPFRSGYDPHILITPDDKRYVIDGHHRAAMYTALKHDVMPSKVLDLRGHTSMLVQAAGSDYEAAAKALATLAARQEPGITAAMKTLVNKNHGHLSGLDNRLKAVPSLTRKISSEAPEFGGDAGKTAAHMSDPLRYTMVFRPEEYVGGAKQVLDELRAQGYRDRVKNYWERGDNYNGINAALTAPTGGKVELQFHTPESLDIKQNKAHPLYTRFRVSQDPHERYILDRKMTQMFDAAEQPGGVLDIPSLKRVPNEPNPRQMAASVSPVDYHYQALLDDDGHVHAVIRHVVDHAAPDARSEVWRDGKWVTENEYARYHFMGENRSEDISEEQARAFTGEAPHTAGYLTLDEVLALAPEGDPRANLNQIYRDQGDEWLFEDDGVSPTLAHTEAGSLEPFPPFWTMSGPVAGDPGAEADLHPEPEPALPTTDGGDEDIDLFGGPFGGVETGIENPSVLAPVDPTGAAAADQDFLEDQTPVAGNSPFFDDRGLLASREASTTPPPDSREWLLSGPREAPREPGAQVDPSRASTSDIAAMAKLALAKFSPEEQRELIDEGGDGVLAANLSRLDLTGTHYQALEEALARNEDDPEGIFT